MRTFRKIASLLPLMLGWLAVSALVWGFTVARLSDVKPKERVSLYTTAAIRDEAEIARWIEAQSPGGVKRARVKEFRYFMFGRDELETGDVFLVAESEINQFSDWFEGEGVLLPENSRLSKSLALLPGENYRLFPGANSVHKADGARDALIQMLTEEEIP